MKYLTVVPDGVAIRNFLHSRLVDLLLDDGDVAVWHSLPETIVDDCDRWQGRVSFGPIPVTDDPLTARLLRHSRNFAHLYWARDPGTLHQLKRMTAPRHWRPRLTMAAGHVVGRVSAVSTTTLLALDAVYERMASGPAAVRACEALLDKETPDVVFCTHQRAVAAVPTVMAARRLGVPSATFIYSWDNLPKQRMTVIADHYLVWSEHMKQQLLMLYPQVADDHVHVVGTPQFEHYFDRGLVEPRGAFLRALGLDPDRRVICFSGDDVVTSPHDPSYLADLAEAVRGLPDRNRPQIVFRRCPTDLSDRYQQVLASYPEIAVSDPQWFPARDGDWSGVVPTVSDVALLTNLVHHCDLVVNMGSTMGMDFAALGKPSVYLAYQPTPVDASSRWRVEENYQLPHFRSVHTTQPVHWVRERETLAETVLCALRPDDGKAQARDAWLRTELTLPLDLASERCRQALRDIAASRR